MHRSLAVWFGLFLAMPTWALRMLGYWAHQSRRCTTTCSLLESDKSLPSLLEYNSSFSGISFIPFPGAENISVHLTMGRNNDRFIPTALTQCATPQSAWQYWEDRRNAEDQLKKAIMRNEVPRKLVPYFKNYRKYTEVEISEVLQLNHDFFSALSNADITAMKSLWSDSPDALFQMANSEDFISGYDDIIAYLSKTLEPINPISFNNATVHFMGDVAIVTSQILTVKAVDSKGRQRSSSRGGGNGFGGINVIAAGGGFVRVGQMSKLLEQNNRKRNKNEGKRFRKAYAYVYNVFRRSPTTQRYQLLLHYGTIVDPLEAFSKSLYRDPTSPYVPSKRSAPGMDSLQSLLFGGMNPGDEDDDEDDDDEDEDDEVDEDEEDEDEDEDDELEMSDEDDDDDEDDGDYDDDDDDDNDGEDDDDDEDEENNELLAQLESINDDEELSEKDKKLFKTLKAALRNDNSRRNSRKNKSNKSRKDEDDDEEEDDDIPKDAIRKSLLKYDQEGKPIGGVLVISKRPGSPNNIVDRVKAFIEAIRTAKSAQQSGTGSRDGNNNNKRSFNYIDNVLNGNNGFSNNRDSSNNIVVYGPNGPSIRSKDSFNNNDDEIQAAIEFGRNQLSTRTTLTIRWLYKEGRLSDLEKQILTTTVIDSAKQKPSKIEIACALLLIDLDLSDLTKVKNMNSVFAKVNADDMAEFEAMCHRIVEEQLSIAR